VSDATLVLTEETWATLTDALNSPQETAAIVIAGKSDSEDELALLARDVQWVPRNAYLTRQGDRLEILSSGYIPAVKAAAEQGAVAVFFHTHPRGDPRASRFDLDVDVELNRLFTRRTRQPWYASLILGGSTDDPRVSGLLYANDDHPISLRRVRIVGRRLRIMYLEGADSANLPESAFDRQVRAFGKDGQLLLNRLRVGVVGAGGTGSAVCEQLIRIGVKRITVVDDDFVSESNLTRIYGAGRADIGKPKVQVVWDNAERIGLGTTVNAVVGRVTSEAVAKALRGCDVIFGCTDDNAGRAVLSRFAYWYLVPVIDMGFMISSKAASITGLYGRVTTLMPGTPCLFCRRRLNLEALRSEVLPEEERAALAREGYVAGLGEPDPSVITFTTMTAAFALNELLDRLIGYGPDHAPSEIMLRVHDRMLSSRSGSGEPEHYCSDRNTWGRGDMQPFLGQLWI
jgi:molybdopterin/thiamine biosynthesis adenylyltransferase/proteasome lid subunit RPN8/RPN11